MHGPTVALGDDDALVAFDGGGPGEVRLREVCDLVGAMGRRSTASAATPSASSSSVFALTKVVQRIALRHGERLGTTPTSFGKELPGRGEIWAAIPL